MTNVQQRQGSWWETPRPTTVAELRDCPATVPVASRTEPNAAGALGYSRRTAYIQAQRGAIPTIRIGMRGVRVPVEPLLRMLGADAGDSAGDTRAADG